MKDVIESFMLAFMIMGLTISAVNFAWHAVQIYDGSSYSCECGKGKE